MDFYHEIITTENELPARILLHSVNQVAPHWHNSLELFLALSGKANVNVDGTDLDLNEGDLLVINPNEIHSIVSTTDNLILALQIRSSFWERVFPCLYQERILCCSAQDNANKSYASIKRMMAEIALIASKRGKNYAVKLQGLLYELLYELVTYHSDKTMKSAMTKTSKHMDRLESIMKYIKDHHKSPLSLEDVAKSQNLSPNYLASFMKSHMGTTFLSYLNSIRLESAKNDLISTDLFITDIALNNGFPNTKAFHKTFKDIYGVTPNLYRSKRKISDSAGGFNYLQITNTNIFSVLDKYLSPDPVSQEKYYPAARHSIEINSGIKGKELLHSWKSLITFGRASDGLSAEVQRQLTEMQKDIGFKYVRFHGLLDDSMLICNKTIVGYQFNFIRVLELFDFLLSIQLKPFAGISFMPTVLAKIQKSLFITKSIQSMPEDMEVWCQLIQGLLKACIARYGVKEVRSWYFEFWNEPEITGFMWNHSEEDYLVFYQATYNAVKEVDEGLKFGGPACFAETIIKNTWFDRFISFARKNHCLPDFITLHAYPILEGKTLDELSKVQDLEAEIIHNSKQMFKISPDEDYLSNTLIRVKETLKNQELHHLPLFMTEWNSTIWHRDLCSDTCYKSAYLAKNLTENMDQLDGFGHWTLSDRMEELFPTTTLFHGGLGLVTYNGIKKAGYYTYSLMNKLGNRLLKSGNGYFATKNERLSSHNVQILLYNYCHYDENYQNLDTSYISQTSRYNVFANEQEATFQLSIEGFQAGMVRILETRINRKNGSAYDLWADSRLPESLSPDELKTLKMLSIPGAKSEERPITGTLDLNCSLQPHEVVLIEVISLTS